MGLISRVSSRTYRCPFHFLKIMSNISKPLIILGSITTVGLLWALWYDNKRRSSPMYKQALVNKRKQELQKQREKNDPFYHVKTLPLCESFEQDIIKKYTQEYIEKGEDLILKQEIMQGAAHIALALCYVDPRYIEYTMLQLRMQLPPEVMMAIQRNMQIAKPRCQEKYISYFTNAKKSAAGDASTSKITELQENAAPILVQVKDSLNNSKNLDDIGDSEILIEETLNETKMEKYEGNSPDVDDNNEPDSNYNDVDEGLPKSDLEGNN